MIICSHSNIDIIQGVIGYGDTEGITDWRISNTITNENTAILNILNSTSTNTRVSILENGNVGIGTTNPASILDIVGDANITGVYKKNNRDVINDTSNYVQTTSNIIVPRILTEVGNGSNYVSRLTTSLNTRIDNTSNYVQSTCNLFANSVGAVSQWTNVSSGIYYSITSPSIITSSPSATTTSTTDNYIYMVFTYTTETAGAGTRQTQYTINVPTGGYICDILLVGGGGGGSVGGGGGGGYRYLTNVSLNTGNYTVNVGNGGSGNNTGSTIGIQGANSSFIGGTINYIAYGGGGGNGHGALAPAHTTGQVGSYGGNGSDSTARQTYTSLQGNRGGSSIAALYGSGGGGGGAGGVGSDSVYVAGLNAGSGANSYNKGGQGGDGKSNSITGTLVYYAGGGNAGTNTDSGTDTSTQNTPIGGGGLGSRAPNGNGSNGIDGLGGGGGGGDYQRTTAGNGGSGIVIIRYKKITSSTIDLIRGVSGDVNTDYSITNYGGDFKIISSTSSVNTEYIRITSSGASIYNPTGSPQWSTVSDRRIKENIEKASYDKCYDNINKLELYRFNYIKELKNINKDQKQLGYIAQEVQDIFPKAISMQEFNNNNLNIPNMLSIDITQINYSLYGTVKKLIEMYNNKKTRLERLEYILKNNSSNVINVINDTFSSNIDIQDTLLLT